MIGLLFLGALLCGAAADVTSNESLSEPIQEDKTDAYSPSPIFITTPSQTDSTINMPPALSSTVSQTSKSHSTSRSPGPQSTTTSTSTTTTTFIDMYSRKCLPVFMVAGGLIIACTILLISTMLLMCKVCQLSNRVKMLSDNGDLISTSEYWMGTAKKSKSVPETEAKETTMLMSDTVQEQEDVGNGAAKEEAVKVKEDRQTGQEDKKEVGDAAKSEEASTTPVTVVENASSSKPQEEATDSQSVKAEAAPSSKGTEEPKEEV